ncbi:very short patch repair endonuclease [Rhodanobacter glycinis]|uniref:very short patch repair endonuclease n=1 Tax=Rhodanobacter glycinis TaxID=582702 RepID=UPI000B88CED5
MADIFTPAKRSEVMSHIKGRGNQRTEIAFMRLLRQQKITGWRRHKPVTLVITPRPHTRGRRQSVRPDFVFSALRLAVFIDGCFWHGCPRHGVQPTSNELFWRDKIQGNAKRDRRVARALRRQGWSVLRVWEHEMHAGDKVIARLQRSMARCAERIVDRPR